jgi:hypothetical protein
MISAASPARGLAARKPNAIAAAAHQQPAVEQYAGDDEANAGRDERRGGLDHDADRRVGAAPGEVHDPKRDNMHY